MFLITGSFCFVHGSKAQKPEPKFRGYPQKLIDCFQYRSEDFPNFIKKPMYNILTDPANKQTKTQNGKFQAGYKLLLR